MVVVRRRSSASTTTPPFRLKRPKESPMSLSSPSEVKMGDGRHSPTEWMAHYPATSHVTQSPTKPEFAFDNIPVTRYDVAVSRRRTNWWSKMFALCSAISWFYTGRRMYSSRRLVSALEHELRETRLSFGKADASRKETQNLLTEVKSRRSELQNMNGKLEHEVKMIEMMLDEGVDVHAPRRGENEALGNWMNERLHGLEHHWHTFRNFIQYQSRQAISHRFGPGPHRVEVSVQIEIKEQSSEAKFVVEMVPADDLPHSVFFFLNSVDKKLWDNTVFLHHEEVDHIMAAVPLDYKSQGIKQADIQALELQSLAFPEYSAAHPHAKYTLGFADVGPTFFINTADNTETHGPGGQEHHRMPEDADPCFGHVVEGTEVVDALLKYGVQSPNRVSPTGNHPWGDNDHTWSRIVSMRILPPPEESAR